MMSAALVSRRPVLRMRPCGAASVSPGSPCTSGMTATPVSNPDSPSASFGNRNRATATIITGLPCVVNSAVRQSASNSGWCTTDHSSTASTMALQVRYPITMTTARPIASWKPFRKTAPRAASSRSVSQHRVVEGRRRERVVDDVLGRVGGRQRDRDHEVGGREPEQDQDQRLALPAGQQLLEQRDAALAVWAQRGDPPVDRQGAEQGQGDEDERRERRQDAGREERDARLVAERREVVDPGEAHDLPPGGGVGRCVSGGGGRVEVREEPGPQS